MTSLRKFVAATVRPSVSRCIAALTLTAIVAVSDYSSDSQDFVFAGVVTPSAAGETKVYLDDGSGFDEATSVGSHLKPGVNQLRLPFPPGIYRALRLDPTDYDCPVALADLRILNPAGAAVRRIAFDELIPNGQIERVSPDGDAVRITPKRGVNDPYLTLRFQPPLQLKWDFRAYLRSRAATLVGWFIVTFVVLGLVPIGLRLALATGARLWRWCRKRPRSGLALVAVLAAVSSSYPVVFFGKSFVSPNAGTVMLYDRIPMVPDLGDTEPEYVYGADVGAMMWAHYPYTVVTSRALRTEGVLPLWNRYNSCGIPLLGQGQAMLLDPINLLVALAGAPSWAVDLKYVLCKALFACGLGWCVWLLTRDLAAAAIIAFAGAFVAFFNYRVNHPAIFSLSYSPWVLVAWLQLARVPRGFPAGPLALWFAANWLLLNSGTAKEALALCLTLNLAGALALVVDRLPAPIKRQRFALIMVTGLTFLLASAPLWWTFADVLRASHTMYDAPHVFQIRPAWLIGLFDDIFYRALNPQRNVYAPAANFLVLLGCLFAIVQPVRLMRDGPAAALLISFLGTILIAFAWVPAEWIAAVPLLRSVHHVGIHFSCAAVVLAAVLAGWGFAAARPLLTSRQGRRYIWCIAALVALFFWAYFRGQPAYWTGARGFVGWWDSAPDFTAVYANVLLLPLALVVLTFAAKRRLQRAPFSPFLFGAAVLSLAIVLGRHGLHLPAGSTNPYFHTPGTRANLSASSATIELLRRETAAEPGRIIGTGHLLMTGYMSVHGFESLNGPDALFSPHYRELLDAARMVPAYDWHAYLAPAEIATWQPMLDFLNVGYLVTHHDVPPNTLAYQRIASLDLDVYRASHSWPRAFFTDQLGVYADERELVARVRSLSGQQPFAAVQQNDRNVPGTHRAPSRLARIVPARDYRLSSNSTSFAVTAPGPGYVVLQEAWWPDTFRVTVDGEPASYFRVNHAFKGVEIKRAGEHRISFAYWPGHFTASLVLCAVGFVGFATILFRSRQVPPVRVSDADRTGKLSARSELES